MTNQAPQEGGRRDQPEGAQDAAQGEPQGEPLDREADSGTDQAAAAAGPPEGFEPPPGPGERPWPSLGQEAAGGPERSGQAPGERPWPTLGQEAAGQAPSGGYGLPEPHYYGYQAGPEGPPRRPRRLYRSEHDKVIAGVCGGLHDYLGVDANLLRVLFVLFSLFAGGSGLLVYVVLWALVPRQSRVGLSPAETAMDAVNEVRDRFQGLRRA